VRALCGPEPEERVTGRNQEFKTVHFSRSEADPRACLLGLQPPMHQRSRAVQLPDSVVNAVLCLRVGQYGVHTLRPRLRWIKASPHPLTSSTKVVADMAPGVRWQLKPLHRCRNAPHLLAALPQLAFAR
jgi:hypothetical protein